MNAPRLEIDLGKIYHNAAALVERLGGRGISVTGITKATLGSAGVAQILLKAGVKGLGDSRIENIEAMRAANVPAPMTLIRSPMPSQINRVVANAEISFNTEIDVIRSLSLAAQEAKITHGVVLMIELGDLREGIMADDLIGVVRKTLRCPNIELKGIGTNLACRSGVSPSDRNMAELSALAESVETTFDCTLEVVSGGNSANLNWALHGGTGSRINNLRLGESILLGREPLHRRPIDGLHTDAISLIAEVIESKTKPSQPWGEFAEAAFGNVLQSETASAGGSKKLSQTILAIGHQDTDPSGLQMEPGVRILGASSDHLVVETGHFTLRPGAEMVIQPNYSALMRAMTSPFVSQVLKPLSAGAAPPAGI